MFSNLGKLSKPSNSGSSFLEQGQVNRSFSLGLNHPTPHHNQALIEQISLKLAETEAQWAASKAKCESLQAENSGLRKENNKLKQKAKGLEEQTCLLMGELERASNHSVTKKPSFINDSTLDSLETSLDEGPQTRSFRQQFESLRGQYEKAKGLLTQSTAEVARLSRAVSQIESINRENEALEQQVNKLRNEKNLIQLELDETQNKTYKQETLRMLEKEGIQRLEEKHLRLEDEVAIRATRTQDLESEIENKNLVIEELRGLVEGKFTCLTNEVSERLRLKNQVILLLKEEINRLKENKVFVFEPGAPDEICGDIYSGLLDMRAEMPKPLRAGEITRLRDKEPWSPVHKSNQRVIPKSDSKLLTNVKSSLANHKDDINPTRKDTFPDFKDLSLVVRPTFQSTNLFDDTLIPNSGKAKNSLFRRPHAFLNTQKDSSSEMESILKSKLDILHDNNQSLTQELKQKESHIKTLTQKVAASKTLIKENLNLMSREQESRQLKHFIVQNITDRLRTATDPKALNTDSDTMNMRDVRGIRNKMSQFSGQLKTCYGSCIDLFLGMDKDSLVLLERRLNECISLDKDIQANLFGETVASL